MILSPKLRVPEPTVGAIHQEMVIWALYISTVMAINLNWVILTEASINTEFTATSYYVWNTGNADQLLFIFPIRVSLTTITLHYYSDSLWGRPRLRFYVVPDNFDVWDVLTSGNPYVGVASVPPSEEPAGLRSVKIRLNGLYFNTKKVFMYKYSSFFSFAVSEVEFFTNCSKWAMLAVQIRPW